MSHLPMPALGAIAGLLASLGSSALGSTIYLTDGRVLDGTVTSPAGAAIVDIQLTSGSYIAILHVPSDQVQRIDATPTRHEQALDDMARTEQALSSDGSSAASAWLQLSRQAASCGEITLQHRFAQEALIRDPADTQAHRLSGDVLQNGGWMRPEEAAAARGEVRFRGHWVPHEDMDKTLAAEAASRAARDAAHQQVVAAQQARLQAQQALAFQGAYPASDAPWSNTGYSPYAFGYGSGFSYPGVASFGSVIPYSGYRTDVPRHDRDGFHRGRDRDGDRGHAVRIMPRGRTGNSRGRTGN